jgi:hypothetical protein
MIAMRGSALLPDLPTIVQRIKFDWERDTSRFEHPLYLRAKAMPSWPEYLCLTLKDLEDPTAEIAVVWAVPPRLNIGLSSKHQFYIVLYQELYYVGFSELGIGFDHNASFITLQTKI